MSMWNKYIWAFDNGDIEVGHGEAGVCYIYSAASDRCWKEEAGKKKRIKRTVFDAKKAEVLTILKLKEV